MSAPWICSPADWPPRGLEEMTTAGVGTKMACVLPGAFGGQRGAGAFGPGIAAPGASTPCQGALRSCCIGTSWCAVDGKGAAVKGCCHIWPRFAARWAPPRAGAAGILISFTRGQTSPTSFFWKLHPIRQADKGTRRWLSWPARVISIRARRNGRGNGCANEIQRDKGRRKREN